MTQPETINSEQKDSGGVYPGSFDPVTRAHLDLIKQAAYLMKRLVVVVAINSDKNPWFTDEEKVEMLRHEIEHVVKPELEAEGIQCEITVELSSGLTAAFMKANNATIYVRGARTGSEFEFEQRMAMANILENPSIRPVFLATRKPELNFVSSTIARDLARHHGNSLEAHVTPYVAEKLRERAAQKYPPAQP